MDVTALVLLLITLPFSLGKSRLICQTQPIQAEEGDDVTIQCRLDPPVNLVDYTLDVTRADLDEVVHSYRDGKDHSDPQVDQYRNRTTLIHEDLIRGIITLQISSVQLNDSGPYICYVSDLKASYTIVLRVAKKSQHNKTSTEDFRTMRPLVTKNTKPPNSDAETVIVGAIVGVFVLAALIIGVLVNRGTIRRCVERLRVRRERDPEKAANGGEMEERRIKTEGEDENLENPAENSRLNITSEV